VVNGAELVPILAARMMACSFGAGRADLLHNRVALLGVDA
jgi:hypothetical protein